MTITGLDTISLGAAGVSLRKYVPSDAEAFVSLFQDPEVSRYVGDGEVGSESDDAAMFGRIFDPVYSERRFAVWAVEVDGRFAGHAELKPSPSDDVPGWELVYLLERALWGRGLGAQVARLVTDHALGAAGLPAVFATIDSRNTGSVRIVERLGYVLSAERDEGNQTVLIYRKDA